MPSTAVAATPPRRGTVDTLKIAAREITVPQVRAGHVAGPAGARVSAWIGGAARATAGPIAARYLKLQLRSEASLKQATRITAPSRLLSSKSAPRQEAP
jgi:hypothetical protein